MFLIWDSLKNDSLRYVLFQPKVNIRGPPKIIFPESPRDFISKAKQIIKIGLTSQKLFNFEKKHNTFAPPVK